MPTKTERVALTPAIEDTQFGDTVFHLTPVSNAAAILEKGLHPNPERGREASWRRLERFMDDIRPEHIRELGISRRHGIFAYTDIEVMKPRYLGEREYRRFLDSDRQAKDDTAFAIDVDPTRVMVFDMGDLQGIESRLAEDTRLGSATVNETIERGLRYWNNGLTLDDFRRRYESRHTPHFSDCELKAEYNDGTPGLKYMFWTPEVIVPGPIVGESVRWVASKLTLLDVG